MTGRSRFWVISVAAVVGIVVTGALGRWQMDRAAQKEAQQDAIAQQAQLPALDGRALQGFKDVTQTVHRRAHLRGTWLPQYTVWLDNRQMNAKQGFFMLTPLQLEGSTAAVLVQRGWATRDFSDRTRLPNIATPSGLVEIEGRLALSPARLYELGQGSNGRIRQNLDLAAYAQETRLALLGVSVLQTGPAGDGLVRDWPAAETGVAKHYGYAFQWWALSGLIAVLYAWFQFIAPHVRSRRARQ